MLCARNVKEVLPELEQNKNHLEKMVSTANDQIAKKGVEINKFVEENNIKIKGNEMNEKPEPAVDVERDNRNHILVTN